MKNYENDLADIMRLQSPQREAVWVLITVSSESNEIMRSVLASSNIVCWETQELRLRLRLEQGQLVLQVQKLQKIWARYLKLEEQLEPKRRSKLRKNAHKFVNMTSLASISERAWRNGVIWDKMVVAHSQNPLGQKIAVLDNARDLRKYWYHPYRADGSRFRVSAASRQLVFCCWPGWGSIRSAITCVCRASSKLSTPDILRLRLIWAQKTLSIALSSLLPMSLVKKVCLHLAFAVLSPLSQMVTWLCINWFYCLQFVHKFRRALMRLSNKTQLLLKKSQTQSPDHLPLYEGDVQKLPHLLLLLPPLPLR